MTTVQCSKSTPEPWPEPGVVTYDIWHRGCWGWENDESSKEWMAGHDGKDVAKIVRYCLVELLKVFPNMLDSQSGD